MKDWIRWLVGGVVFAALLLGLCMLSTQAAERQNAGVPALSAVLDAAPQLDVLKLDAAPRGRYKAVERVSYCGDGEVQVYHSKIRERSAVRRESYTVQGMGDPSVRSLEKPTSSQQYAIRVFRRAKGCAGGRCG